MEKGIYTDVFFNLTDDKIYKSKVIKDIDSNIGHKGLFGDAINVMLAVAAYNFKRAVRVLLYLINKISETLLEEMVSLKYAF